MSDPIVIVSAARTPIGGLLGDFSSQAAWELGAVAIRAAVERAGAEQPKSSRAQLRCALGVALRRAGRESEAAPFLVDDCPVMAQWGLADRSVLAWQNR